MMKPIHLFNKQIPIRRVAGIILLIVLAWCVSLWLAGRLRVSVTESAGGHVFWRIPCPETITASTIVEIRPSINDRYVPHPRRHTLIKQVACLPGQRLSVIGNSYYCDGFFLGSAVTRTRDGKPISPWKMENGQELTIPEGLFFLMNHNAHSYDSRYYGPVSRERITGCMLPLF